MGNHGGFFVHMQKNAVILSQGRSPESKDLHTEMVLRRW